MNLSWPSADSAWRRACRSPRFARVISRSTSGFTAFAFAVVVSIRSWSISSLDRFIRSALRCAESRDSLCLFLWWRIAAAQPTYAARRSRPRAFSVSMTSSIDLRPKFGIAFSSDSDFWSRSPTVCTPARLRQLYERTPSSSSSIRMSSIPSERPAGSPPPPPPAPPPPPPSATAGHEAVVAAPQLLEPVGVGEDRERRDQDLGRLAQRRLRLDGAVGLDVERELVVVRALADARRLDLVRHALHGREDRVDRDHADRLVGRLVVLGRRVAAAAPDGEVHLELGLLLERRDVRLGVEDLDAGRQVDVARGHVAGAGRDERHLDLGGLGVHPRDDLLQVEDDVGHVLLHARDRRELVRHALDPHARDCGAGERAQQHPPERVAERVAEAAIERLDRERASVVLDLLGRNLGGLELEHGLPSCREPAARRPAERGRPGEAGELLRVELDDELLLHRRVDLRTLGVAQHLRRQSVVIRLKPRRYGGRQFGRIANRLGRAGPSLDRDHIVGTHLVRGHVHAPAVDGPVAVQDELARLAPRSRKAQPHEHVVEPALQQAQQVLTRDARLPAGLLVVRAELPLEHAVVAARLLLLAQLQPVLGLLRAAASVLARRVRAPLDAALVREAALALEEELDALAAALLALGTSVACHLDAPPLAGAAAVVGLRRDVADARDLEAGGLERADRGLAARARALDEHLDTLEALVDALARGGVGRDLGGERRGLARALEAGATGGLPRDHVAVLVGQGDDRVVEAGLDVRLAERDVLARLAAPAAACWSLLSHLEGHAHFFTFFLPATCMRFGPLRVRALVFVRWPSTGSPRRWRRPR